MNKLSNTELEQGILSTILWDSTLRFDVSTDGLTADCFTDATYRRLFLTLRHMTEQGVSIREPTLVVDAYNRMGCDNDKSTITLPEYVKLVSPSPYRLDIAENVPQYVRVLIDLANRRHVLNVLQQSAESIMDLTVDAHDTTAMTMKQITDYGSDNSSTVTFGEGTQLLMDGIMENINGTSQSSIATGLRQLDICGGLHPSNLVIIAAMSSHGKTALATTIAMNMLLPTVLTPETRIPKIAYYSMEMTPRELMARIMARYSKIPSNLLMYGKLTDQQLKDTKAALKRTESVKERLFFYKMEGMSVESISQNIRYLHSKDGISVVIIDYLQILGLNTPKGQTRETVIAAAARDFKNLADRLGITIILLSQMNRDTSRGRFPTVDRIRDSGEINESADVTLIIYRPEQEKDTNPTYPPKWENIDVHDTALISVAKDRNGGTGGLHEFIVGFNPQLTYFRDLDSLPQRGMAPSGNKVPWVVSPSD